MGTWNNASVQKCKAVADIMSILREAGAAIETFRSPTVDQTLDQGEHVLADDALWAAIPPRMRLWSRQELRGWLQAERP
jgi:hypothetical protein